MVIIHGFGEHAGRYANMMDYLAGQGISTLALDLEGHGPLSRKKGVSRSYDIMHGDVALGLSEAAARFPGQSLFLYGHSMGGGLVLNHGLTKAPDIAGYLVSAPLIIPADPVPGPLRAIVKILRPVLPNMTIKNAIGGDQVTSLAEEQVKYENDPLNHNRLGIGMAVDIIEGGEWVGAQADRWEAPLLLMHAKADKLTQFKATEKFASAAKNCTFMAMENCEHEMHNDVTRDKVYGAISTFILDRA